MDRGYLGQFAPASLKRSPSPVRRTRATVLSGAIRPGLIEADPRPARGIEGGQRYLGQFAPASLKLREPDHDPLIFARLSGAIRPGLIEARLVASPGAGAGRLSGAIRPGLIEALSAHPRDL